MELYTHHTVVKDILDRLNVLDCRLCSIHLVDSFYCWYVRKYVCIVLTYLLIGVTYEHMSSVILTYALIVPWYLILLRVLQERELIVVNISTDNCSQNDV